MHTKKLTPTQAMQELQAAKHGISPETASIMVKLYKRFRNQMMRAKKTGILPANVPSLPICLTYNKAAIYQLMKAPGCVGIRIYPGINNKQQLTGFHTHTLREGIAALVFPTPTLPTL